MKSASHTSIITAVLNAKLPTYRAAGKTLTVCKDT